jgi:hypothetical protein
MLSCNAMYSPRTTLYFTFSTHSLSCDPLQDPPTEQSCLNEFSCYRVLQKCSALETLQLSGNTELSSVSLRRLLQHEPALCTIDLSGCTSIASYLGDSSPQLWIAQKGQKKLKSLTLNSQGFGKDGLEALWLETWGARASVHRAPGGLLCLSLKE